MNIFRLLGRGFRCATVNRSRISGGPSLNGAFGLRGPIPSYFHLYPVAKDEIIQGARFALRFLLVPYPIAEVPYRAAQAYHSSRKHCT